MALDEISGTPSVLDVETVDISFESDAVISNVEIVKDIVVNPVSEILIEMGVRFVNVGSGGAVEEATSSTKGIIRLSGDLSGTADSPVVNGLSTKADASNVYTKSEVDTGLSSKVGTGDSRLFDARIPLAHSHTAADVSSGILDIARIPTGTTGTTAALGNHTHTPASIGAAPASHTHAASDVASGTFALARIPTGTTGTTVSLGNHTHTPAAIGAAAASHTHAAADIASGTLAIARIPVGAVAGTVAAGDDSRIVGAVQKSLVTTKGDLLAATGSGTLARVGAGSDGQALIADAAQASGVRWGSAGAALGSSTPVKPTYSGSIGAATSAARSDHSHPLQDPVLALPSDTDRLYVSGWPSGDLIGPTVEAWAIPWKLPIAYSIKSVLMEVKTAQAGKSLKIGIYRTGTNGLPDQLDVDLCAISMATTGGIEAVLPDRVTINPGLVWIVVAGTEQASSTWQVAGCYGPWHDFIPSQHIMHGDKRNAGWMNKTYGSVTGAWNPVLPANFTNLNLLDPAIVLPKVGIYGKSLNV